MHVFNYLERIGFGWILPAGPLTDCAGSRRFKLVAEPSHRVEELGMSRIILDFGS